MARFFALEDWAEEPLLQSLRAALEAGPVETMERFQARLAGLMKAELKNRASLHRERATQLLSAERALEIFVSRVLGSDGT